MYHLLFISTLIILVPFISLSQSLIKDEVDEFTGNHIIQTDHVRISHEGYSGRSFVSFAHIEGDNYMIITVMSRDSWQILGADVARFIIDENRKGFDLIRMDTDVGRGTTTERYAIILTIDDFISLRDADDVRFRINRNIYELNDEAKKSIGLVVNRLNTQERNETTNKEKDSRPAFQILTKDEYAFIKDQVVYRLGTKASDFEEQFGVPDSRGEASGSEGYLGNHTYLQYFDDGLSVNVNSEGIITGFVFYLIPTTNYSSADVITDLGVSHGTSAQQIYEIYGEPYEKKESTLLGHRLNLYYREDSLVLNFSFENLTLRSMSILAGYLPYLKD